MNEVIALNHCFEPGCLNIIHVTSAGMCRMHYQRFRKSEVERINKLQNNFCIHGECRQPIWIMRHGLCYQHYNSFYHEAFQQESTESSSPVLDQEELIHEIDSFVSRIKELAA